MKTIRITPSYSHLYGIDYSENISHQKTAFTSFSKKVLYQ